MDKDSLEDRLAAIENGLDECKAMLLDVCTFTSELREAMAGFQDNGFLSNILGGLLGKR